MAIFVENNHAAIKIVKSVTHHVIIHCFFIVLRIAKRCFSQHKKWVTVCPPVFLSVCLSQSGNVSKSWNLSLSCQGCVFGIAKIATDFSSNMASNNFRWIRISFVTLPIVLWNVNTHTPSVEWCYLQWPWVYACVILLCYKCCCTCVKSNIL